jgi:hypothetical protein
VVRLGERNARNVRTKLRQMHGGAGEHIPVCGPTPKEDMGLTLLGGIQILKRYKEKIGASCMSPLGPSTKESLSA